MNRNDLHKEIEQLIHSIKLHYNHIQEETRIPTIELELITAKIRKLHERSILYNHIHFLEEQGLMLTRIRPAQRNADLVAEVAAPALFASKPKTLDPPAAQPTLSAPPAPEAAPIQKAEILEPSEKASSVSITAEPQVISAPSPSAAAPAPTSAGHDLNSFISFNDRYVFISKLFWGNADEYKRGISGVNTAGSLQEAEAVVKELGVRFKWDSDNEAVKLFHTIVQRVFSR